MSAKTGHFVAIGRCVQSGHSVGWRGGAVRSATIREDGDGLVSQRWTRSPARDEAEGWRPATSEGFDADGVRAGVRRGALG